MRSFSGLALTAAFLPFASMVQASPCTAIPNLYPFFMYAFNDGKLIFTRPIAFEPVSKGGPLGLAINYDPGPGFYPATFNITKQNLISKTNNVGEPQISTSLASNSFVTFQQYNSKQKHDYGLFGLQQYNQANKTFGENGCIVTVNHAVVPFYLCPSGPDTDGQLFVTYQADPTRYCIDIELIAITEG